MITIITDSTSDLTAEQLRLAGIQTMPMYIQHQGEEFENMAVSPQQMLDRVRRSGQPATTRPATADDMAKVYRQLLVSSDHIVHVANSRELTTAYANARQAADAMGGRVTVVDSGMASFGLGVMALRAAKWNDQGMPAVEIARRLADLRHQVLFAFAVENLDFLRINGRVGAAAAFFGNLLGVSPLLKIEHGQIVPVGRARGQGVALKELSKMALQFQQDQGRTVDLGYVYTAGGEAGAHALRAQLSYLHAHDLGMQPLGAGITANAGSAYGLVMLPSE